MAFGALLAGCSGGASQLAPAGSQGGSTTQSVVRVHTPTINLRGDLGNRIPHLTENRFAGTVAPSRAFLYASDNSTGDVDIFPEDNPFNPIATCGGCGGWGLAVSPAPQRLLAMGTLSGTVAIYKLNPGNPVFVRTLALTGGGDAFGICFDDQGGIYADNFPTNTIDHWTSASLGTGHTAFLAIGDVNDIFYLACDKESPTVTKLYAYGINTGNDDVNVDWVAPGGAETPETLVGSAADINPGGLAIAANDDMVVNERSGKLYDMGTTEPWAGHATNGCTWGGGDTRSIVWDNTDAEVWGGDIVGTTTFAESIAAPIPPSGPCATGESGGPTKPIAGEKYYGVAVYPNKGD
jgi:hypothetical protein